MAWREYKRSDAVVGAATAFVSLRPAGIAFSRGFVRKAGLIAATRVTLLLDEQHHKLGFRFHNGEREADAFALTGDGGRAKEARAIQSKLIYAQHPWLAAPLKGPARDRRFEPQLDEKAGIWFVDVSSPASRKQREG